MYSNYNMLKIKHLANWPTDKKGQNISLEQHAEGKGWTILIFYSQAAGGTEPDPLST